ncbi:hypothetical protein [Ilumatobacter nonamiensis]|uniref:hypothetical protein n=1 Tax=Ilumatobacter nonamiensis TaxID=467093 RepID=UPI0003455E6B|nr:hypothetical protein [Ilumatobacter nonamiensis]
MTRQSLSIALAVGVTAGATAGCGSDEQTHTVTATDFAYAGIPETMSVGDQLELENESETEIHELVAFRLADDETRSIEELVALPPDELLGLVSPEPAAVLLAAPGGDMIAAVGDGTFAEPGRYGVICVIPTGADPDEYLAAAAESDGPPDVAGGPPHIVSGMFDEFTVEN